MVVKDKNVLDLQGLLTPPKGRGGPAINETIIMGEAGFNTVENDAAAWDAAPKFTGTTCF